MFGKNSIQFFSTLIFGLFLLGTITTHAALKDSDLDSLTDEAEISIYRTDPNKYDTDGDTISDGQEILDHTNPLDPKNSKLAELDNKLEKTLPYGRSFAWYIESGFLVIIITAVSVFIVVNRKSKISNVQPVTTELSPAQPENTDEFFIKNGRPDSPRKL